LGTGVPLKDNEGTLIFLLSELLAVLLSQPKSFRFAGGLDTGSGCVSESAGRSGIWSFVTARQVNGGALTPQECNEPSDVWLIDVGLVFALFVES